MTLKRYYVLNTGVGTQYKQYQLRQGSIVKSISWGLYTYAALNNLIIFCCHDKATTTVANGGDWSPMLWCKETIPKTDVSYQTWGGVEKCEIPVLSGYITLIILTTNSTTYSFLSVTIDEPEGWNPSFKSSRGL